MSTIEDIFASEMNLDRATIKGRAKAVMALLDEDFKAATRIIGYLNDKTPKDSNGHRTMEAQISHVFTNLVAGTRIGASSGMLGTVSHTIEMAILRMEGLESHFGDDFQKLPLEIKPSVLLQNIKDKLNNFVPN